MVKPDFDLWTGTDPTFRVVNRFCILCLIGSRVGSGNSRVGSGFSFCSPISRISRLGRSHTFSLIVPFNLFLDSCRNPRDENLWISSGNDPVN
ncbi:hypothetical protein HanIR_Chr02g0093861 [Helianthus annuus]|nr:hypothetical protein HanIR_Chr02g0093861 [Helianthus annuus]